MSTATIIEARYALTLRCPCGNEWTSSHLEHQTYVQCRNAARRDGWTLPNAWFGITRVQRVLCPACSNGGEGCSP